jgi:hypothetical protein
MGYPDRCVALPPDADDATIDQLCHQRTASLELWIAEQQKRAREQGVPAGAPYDGTLGSACRVYQTHPRSRFHKVKSNTRKTYTDSLKVVETASQWTIRNMTVFDVEYLYEEWKKPAQIGEDENGKPIFGTVERIDRAHDAVAMLKMVIRFVGTALRRPECKLLAEELAKWQFEKGGAREEELTFHHAIAFRDKALEMGQKGILPADDALYMAIGVCAQFDLGLRPKDIIGHWMRTQAEAEREAKKARIEALQLGGGWWIGQFTWERIPGWRWRMRTSKSKYRSPMDFDLERYTLLFPLLELVPHEQRTGSIVKGEHALPIRSRTYQKRFRKVARAAGIPDEVWSMDARAGAATEALEADVPLATIQHGGTGHARPDTTLRYIRRRAADTVADARGARREAEQGQNRLSESRQNRGDGSR